MENRKSNCSRLLTFYEARLGLPHFKRRTGDRTTFAAIQHAGLLLAGQRCLVYLGEQALAATMLRRTALCCHRETNVVVVVVV